MCTTQCRYYTWIRHLEIINPNLPKLRKQIFEEHEVLVYDGNSTNFVSNLHWAKINFRSCSMRVLQEMKLLRNTAIGRYTSCIMMEIIV